MIILKILAAIAITFVLWGLPVALGIKAARRKNRSPHWMWFGLHPVSGWIAYIALLYAAPLKACQQCGEKVKEHARLCPFCTTPFAASSMVPALTAQERKKRARILGIAILAFVGGMIALTLFTVGTVGSMFKDSGAYREAMRSASNDPRVVDLLGAPVVDGDMASGSLSTQGDASGEADLSIPIRGPKGSARLYVSAKLHAGQWSFQTLEVDPKDGRPRINLLAKP